MRLVDDYREPFSRQLADFPDDHRKFLQCCDDDRLAGFERVLELALGGVDILDNP